MVLVSDAAARPMVAPRSWDGLYLVDLFYFFAGKGLYGVVDILGIFTRRGHVWHSSRLAMRSESVATFFHIVDQYSEWRGCRIEGLADSIAGRFTDWSRYSIGMQEQFADLELADALAWAQGIDGWSAQALESQSPWARTVRLQGPAGTHYLKMLPPHQRGSIESISRLAERFTGAMPALLASQPARGWMLWDSVPGELLDYDSPDEQRRRVLLAYAQLQCAAHRQPDILNGLPRVDLRRLPDRLMAFLSAEPADELAEPPQEVGASYFIGVESAQRYREKLRTRLDGLRAAAERAATLPDSLNHGDLRPTNAAIGADGQGVLIDWDDAFVGPAGMSLHGMFGGITMPAVLLSDSPAAAAAAGTDQGRMIWTYVRALAAGRYADEATLRRLLPSSACCGLMHFVLNFGRFPGEQVRDAVADTLEDRLDDLVDYCDLLIAADPTAADDQARAYAAMGDHARARRLLTDQAARRRGDAELLARLAVACREDLDPQEAMLVAQEALRLAPEMASNHAELAAAQMETLDFEAACVSARKALNLQPDHALAAEVLAQATRLQAVRLEAARPRKVPTLSVQSGSDGVRRMRREELALAAALFDEYGMLRIDNAYDPAMIERLQQAFFDRYTRYFTEADHPDALRLGDKRYMITLDIEPPFNDPALLSAPSLMPLVRKALGEDCVLGAFTGAVSLPGSQDQRLHKDHPALFPDSPLHHSLPAFAAQIMIPLVPLNELNGTTRFYKGTHRIPTEDCEAVGHSDPVLPLGSCLFTDYRCAHHGLGNRSQQVRPILTLVFNRPWFRDTANYGQQAPIRLPDSSYRALPDELKDLVGWWREESRVLARENLG